MAAFAPYDQKRFLNEMLMNELPYSVMHKIHMKLDTGDAWKSLASSLGYTFQEVERFASAREHKYGSPSKELLLDWSHKNPTVSDLYRLLMANKFKLVAKPLEEYVPQLLPQAVTVQNVADPTKQPMFHQQPQQQISMPQMLNPSLTQSTHPLSSSGSVNVQFFPPAYISSDNSMSGLASTPGVQVANMQPFGGFVHNLLGPINSNAYFTTMRSVQESNEGSAACGQPHSRPTETSYNSNSGDRKPAQPVSLKTDTPPQASAASTVKCEPQDSEKYSSLYSQKEVSVVSDGSLNLSEKEQLSLWSRTSRPYAEIVQATNKFDTKQIIGSGGFGTVYLGDLTKTPVAIKVMKEKEKFETLEDRNRHHLAEIITLTRLPHPNIVPLLGYSLDGEKLCLIYDYMKQGSLEKNIACDGRLPLPWINRYEIMMDAARGIQYLHAATPSIMHGDIKSANILLTEHLRAKVADFGLAKENPIGDEETYTVTTKAQLEETFYGSIAYLPATFFSSNSRLSLVTDVFAFGIVFFEICTGEKPQNRERKKDPYLRDYIAEYVRQGQDLLKLKDKNQAEQWPDFLWSSLFQLGLKCAASRKKDRPKMPDVLNALEKLHATIQLHVKMESAKIAQESRSGQPVSHTDQETPSGVLQVTHVTHKQESHKVQPHQSYNEGPMLLQIVKDNPALSSSDPRLQAIDAVKQSVQDQMMVSGIPLPVGQSSSIISSDLTSVDDSDQDLYSAPVKPSGSSVDTVKESSDTERIAEFHRSPPFLLQQQYDEQKERLELEKRGYVNLDLKSSDVELSEQSDKLEFSLSHSTEEINNEINEEMEKSMQNVVIHDKRPCTVLDAESSLQSCQSSLTRAASTATSFVHTEVSTTTEDEAGATDDVSSCATASGAADNDTEIIDRDRFKKYKTLFGD